MSTKTAGIAFALFILLSAPTLHLHGWLAKRARKSTNQWHPPGASKCRWTEQCDGRSERYRQRLQDGAATPAAHHRPGDSSVQVRTGLAIRAAMPADSRQNVTQLIRRINA